MARKQKKDTATGRLFSEPQSEMFDESEEERAKRKKPKKVECLGLTFDSDEERSAYFLERLKEKLADPEFRKTSGFPQGTDEAILRMSDPPYYTACPNPFLEEFVRVTDRDRSKDPPYHREPFAVDVSVGKTDPLYKAHSYHTKVPHLAIVPSILHYTKPGDLVLDGFCGSGMTGVAAQFCGSAPKEYRRKLEAEWQAQGHAPPEWGVRCSVQGDLSPAATFIAANYNLSFDIKAFVEEAERILSELDEELGWMYETCHADGGTKGRINYTVWSEVFACPQCSGEITFVLEALDAGSKRVLDTLSCPSCATQLKKNELQRLFTTTTDPATGDPRRRIKLAPVLINYTIGKQKHEKPLDKQDERVLSKAALLPHPLHMPTTRFPIEEMYHGSRLAPKGFEYIHQLFLPRATQSLAFMWGRAQEMEDVRLRMALLFFFEQAIWTSSVLNRFRPTGYSQVSQYLSGVYYVPSQHSEVAPHYVLDGKLKNLRRTLSRQVARSGSAAVTTVDCAVTGMPADSVDYVFTDPPFGENIPYADLNYLVESWHGVLTAPDTEAIVDKAKKKGLHEYQGLMQACFAEYQRVLKPGRWMTVVFSNSKNAVWRAIQEAMGAARFVVADVRTLDKQQGSYRQVTSSAVKQDLVISAYKPSEALESQFQLGETSDEGCWQFVSEHLSNLPVFLGKGDSVEIVGERTPQMLHDRMIAFHVQRGAAVPSSGPEFLAGLDRQYPERDGMYFLPEQVAEYDKKRARVEKLQQLSLFVNDEATAIQWVRQELQQKPRNFQDIQPQFMKELQVWAKHERTIELKDILQENFLCYEGKGPVPAQIHCYLSRNFKDCRKLPKSDTKLMARAKERWYVPDPGRQGDLEQLRSRRLLTEFEEYKAASKKLKQFRTEAVRAGFKAAYDSQDYETIVNVAEKLPGNVLQEDEKLVMYYDVASTRLGV